MTHGDDRGPAEPSDPADCSGDEPEALERSLALGLRLLESVESFALQLDLGDISLPPVTGTVADRAHIRTAAPLYLASELESTRLLAVVELLAGLLVTGGLRAELGDDAELLFRFRKGRRRRLSAGEREAVFGHLFGKPYGPALATNQGQGRNTQFESLLMELAAALAVRRDPLLGHRIADQVRLQQAVLQLTANLSQRSGGFATFAARDLLTTIHEAIAIMRSRPLQRALGARSLWGAVAAAADRYLNQRTDIASHVTRAQSGQMLLAWLADALPESSSTSLSVAAEHPVIRAAVAWLQATLTLEEARTASSRAGRSSVITGRTE